MPVNRLRRNSSFLLRQLKETSPSSASAELVGPTGVSSNNSNCGNADLEEHANRLVPIFIPGLLLVPNPSAGILLGYLDISFLGLFGYIVGSVVYVASAVMYMEESDDYLPIAPGNYNNILAALIFLIDAIICLLDSWLQYKMQSTYNYTTSISSKKVHPIGTVQVDVESLPFKSVLYDAINNFFFLGAALVYVIQGIWMMDPSTDLTHCRGSDDDAYFCNRFVVNFLGSMLYLASALFSYLGSRESNLARVKQGLPPYKLFTLQVHLLDWFVWGDVVMILASIQPLVTVACTEVGGYSDTFMMNLNLAGCVVFLADSLIYTAGYCYYMHELRTGLVEALVDDMRQSNSKIDKLLVQTNVNNNDDNDDKDFEQDGQTKR